MFGNSNSTRARGIFTAGWVAICLVISFSLPSFGQETPAPSKPVPQMETPTRGTVTNLPIPRFVSLRSDKSNVRRGPSLSHRIDWVFTQPGYPLEVIAEYGHWRRIRDIEGASGWIHYTLLSGVRMGLVQEETVDLHARSNISSRLIAQAEKGALLRLIQCNISWCKVTADSRKGWLLKSGLWGVTSNEILE